MCLILGIDEGGGAGCGGRPLQYSQPERWDDSNKKGETGTGLASSNLVDGARIELATSALRTQRSPS